MAATYLHIAIQYADMVASKQSTMTERRALLTDREREIINGDADVSDSYRYQTISRIRARFDRLAGDLEALEAHGSLADELRAKVCGGDGHGQPRASGRVSAPASGDVSGSSPSTSQPPAADERRDTAPHDAESGSGETPPPISDVVDAVAAGWDDSPDRLEARKAAARAVLEYAREHGSVTKQEAKEHVEPEHPVEAQNPRTWYRKNIRPVLNEAAEYNQSKRAYELTDELNQSGGKGRE